MNALDHIVTAERSDLVQHWHAVFHRDPPANVQVALMRRVLAWHVQWQAVSNKPKGSLAPPSPVLPAQAALSRSASSLSPGTRLLREWQGATHEVLVLNQGFEYQGKAYGSLSALARTITGTPWSGPAFFGVKR